MVRFPHPKAGHPYHMHDMIRGQPGFLRETLDRTARADAAAFLGSPRRLLVTGCGTSFHAALYGAEILQDALGTRAAVHAVHAYDLLFGPAVLRGTTVLGVSHSGATSTTNRALRRARTHGARTLALCGLPDTAMEEVAARTLVIGSTHDRSWANTMSYTSQLAAFASLANRMEGAGRAPALRGLGTLPAAVRRTLATEGAMRRLARAVVRRERVTFLGSGLDEITALEAALKIRETCSLPATGCHPEQYLHGPFVAVDRGESVVALLSRDDGSRADAIMDSLALAGARVATVGERPGADIRLPRTDPWLRPIISVIPLQFLAYYAALERNVDPDVMRSDVPRFTRALEPLFQ